MTASDSIGQAGTRIIAASGRGRLLAFARAGMPLVHFVLMLMLMPWKPVGADDQFPAEIWPILQAHCIACHGEGEKVEGQINLSALEKNKGLQEDADFLLAIRKVLEDYQMPPVEESGWSDQMRTSMITHLNMQMVEVLRSRPFAPTPIRRMNRRQYNNAVVDLLELERDIFPLNEKVMRRYSDYFQPGSGKMPAEVRVQNRPLGKDVDGARAEGFMGVAAFPQDLRAEHGYDTQADHLTLSPLLMESFLQLSESIVTSKDLKPAECGCWDDFFMAPQTLEKEDVEAQVDLVRERLKPFLRQAFRRPPDSETLNRFVVFAESQLQAGVEFTDAMKTLVGATFASPEFIYLYDPGESEEKQAGAPDVGDDLALASRLSFFLWGSVPDDALLDLAVCGRLSEPETLRVQVDRMLNDPKMVRFCDSFPGQWLQLDRLISSIPDKQKFGYFYFHQAYRASMHMMLEPLLLFETILIENRSVLELLDADFTWQSDMLRAAYEGRVGKQEDKILTFKRVPVSDRRWGGVVTNAAVMTMTSTPHRTQPITRGAWLNSVIFNDPPEPPPADVPPLGEKIQQEQENLTLRERFEEHRTRADCAACHRDIDPLGFALENYGPTGLWREQYENGREVDASGTLFNRHAFSDIRDFKDVLLREKRRFVRGFSGHLLSFALGRPLDAVDSQTLDEIADRALEGNDGLRDILKMVTLSDPFRKLTFRGNSGVSKSSLSQTKSKGVTVPRLEVSVTEGGVIDAKD